MKNNLMFHHKILVLSKNKEFIKKIPYQNLIVETNPEFLHERIFSKVIIDCESFKNIDLLLENKSKYQFPVLYFANEKMLPQLLNKMTQEDDICLLNSPADYNHFQIEKFCMKLLNTQDPLTGLLVRKGFFNRFEGLIMEVDSNNPLSIIIMNIDDFKQFNDEYGHACGDAILTGLAHRISSHFPDNALISRTGGNDFSVVIPASQETAVSYAELLGLSIKEKPVYKDIVITVSIGISTMEEPQRLEDVFNNTYKALYDAKANGKDSIVHFSQMEHESLQKNSHLDIDHFENITKVITERVMKKLTLNGRKILNDLQQKAEVDQLTGLYNRRYFDNRLAQEFKLAKTGTSNLVFALIDLDYFGKVNKKYGWLMGDEVLKKSSALITSHIRNNDWAVRYGGEELCIIFHDIKYSDAIALMNRIRQLIEEHQFTYDDNTISITISVGMTEYHSDMKSAEDLIQKAGMQLLKAKESGRNRVMG